MTADWTPMRLVDGPAPSLPRTTLIDPSVSSTTSSTDSSAATCRLDGGPDLALGHPDALQVLLVDFTPIQEQARLASDHLSVDRVPASVVP